MSAQVVRRYSSSFSLAIRLLHPRFRGPIRAIYGFVRLADELTDSFHGHDQRGLLMHYRDDAHRAIAGGISLNPVLHNFQRTAKQYAIRSSLIDAFLDSMAMDLDRKQHDEASFRAYVSGSAEAVGLMCLRVFCEGDERTYEKLKLAAMHLGSAFQQVNFLRDLRHDTSALGRSYFPCVDAARLDDAVKQKIELAIEADFKAALVGINGLPKGTRAGVYAAYLLYLALFRKIQRLPATRIMQDRIRIGMLAKLRLVTAGILKYNIRSL